MTLLSFEFKKSFRKPFVIIAIFVCTLVDLAGIYFTCQGYKRWTLEEDFNKICQTELCGNITNDKIDFVIKEDRRLTDLISDQSFSREFDPNTYTGYTFQDWMLFHDNIMPRMKYAVDYPYLMDDLLKRANENIHFYKTNQNDFEVRKNLQIVSFYSNRSIPEFQSLIGVKYFLYYDFSSILVLLLCLLLISPIFVSEKENKMTQLLPSFVMGRRKIVNIKLIYSILVVFLLNVWFLIVDLCGFALFSHLAGFNLPLYAVSEFKFTSLNLPIWQFILLNFLLKNLGFITIALIIAFASKIINKSVYVFLVGIMPLLLFFVSQFDIQGFFSLAEIINPILLVKNRYLFIDYAAQNIFGYPTQPVIIVAAVNLGMIILMSFLCKTSEVR